MNSVLSLKSKNIITIVWLQFFTAETLLMTVTLYQGTPGVAQQGRYFTFTY